MSIGTATGQGYSATAPTEEQFVGRKLGYRPTGGQPVALMAHSANGSIAAPVAYSAATASFCKIMEAIMEAGFMVVSPFLAGNNWGNDAGIARGVEAVSWAQARGGKSGKVVGIAGSMGGCLTMALARANPDLFSCILLFAPVCSLGDIVSNNRGGLASSVNAAYGGAYDDSTHGPTHSAVQFASQLSGIPGMIWSSDQDTITVPAPCGAVASAWGAKCDYRHGNWGDHGADSNFAAVSIPDVLGFLAANHT